MVATARANAMVSYAYMAVESIELRVGHVHERPDACRPGGPAHPLDDEEDGEHQEDPDRDQHDELVGAEREAGQPSGRRGRQLESGIVGADRKRLFVGNKRMAREKVRQRRPVLELVEAGQEQGVAHEVGGEETEARGRGR